MHRERYTEPPMTLVARFGQMVFVWGDDRIRVLYNARAAANQRNGEARSRRMTKHGRRKRLRAA